MFKTFYQYFIDEYGIDVSDIMSIVLVSCIAFIPYLNFGISIIILTMALVNTLGFVLDKSYDGCIWLYERKLQSVLNTTIFKSRKKPRTYGWDGTSLIKNKEEEKL
jgi:hypothetical protein